MKEEEKQSAETEERLPRWAIITMLVMQSLVIVSELLKLKKIAAGLHSE